MARMIIICFITYISFHFHTVSCQDLFESLLSDSSSCETLCKSTYQLHTYPEPDDLCSCMRGCRLFSIIDVVEEYTDLNATRNSCIIACKDAYDKKETQDACSLGCNNQKSFFIPFQQLSQQAELDIFRPEPIDMSFMSPFLYVHSMYSNMMHKLSNSVSVSWSYYTQTDNGKMVVIRSEPRVVIFSSDPDYKTQNYVETNLAGTDNSATPDLKHSQQSYDSYRLGLRDLDMNRKDSYEDIPQDWLSCISKKTGLSKFILCLVIFTSALGMIWLCLSSTATAKEHKIQIQPQKLSFFGDLDYLKELNEKGLLKKSSPQGQYGQAAPLPIKIKVETI